ncbi:MAG TPA: DUF6069 family protein [Actinophytocola sp.]|nr:DUF6069 family protein [Actinophytocola sp.]
MTGVAHGHLDAGRLWSGGAATAVVAGLLAVVGILFARGVLDVPVLSPEGEGVWGDANTVTYALVSAAVALAATGLMQLLGTTTPQFPTFFTWIMVLLTAIAVVVPLSLPVPWEHKLATAVVNLVIGIAITSIINGVARSAYQRAPRDEQGAADLPPWQPT